MHCLLSIVSYSRSQGTGSEGFDLKGCSTDHNLHCSDLVFWKYINSLSLLWNQWLSMGPVRWSYPGYNREFQALSTFWMLQLAQLSVQKQWWHSAGAWEVGPVVRGCGEEVNEPVAQSERHSWSGPGLTTAWLQDLWHCKWDTLPFSQ